MSRTAPVQKENRSDLVCSRSGRRAFGSDARRSLRDFLPELRKSSNRIRCDSEASYGICVARPFAVDVYLLPNRSTGESSTVEDEVTVAGLTLSVVSLS